MHCDNCDIGIYSNLYFPQETNKQSHFNWSWKGFNCNKNIKTTNKWLNEGSWWVQKIPQQDYLKNEKPEIFEKEYQGFWCFINKCRKRYTNC